MKKEIKEKKVEPKKHRHIWGQHYCNCHLCDYHYIEECLCGKFRSDGKITDYPY